MVDILWRMNEVPKGVNEIRPGSSWLVFSLHSKVS